MTKRLRDLVLIALTTTQSFSQTFDTKEICDRIINIDTTEYKLNFVKSDPIQSTERFNKVNRKLTIRTTATDFTFTDYLEHGDTIITYRIAGEEVKKKLGLGGRARFTFSEIFLN